MLYGGSSNESVYDRICDINLSFRDVNVRERALFEAIRQLPKKFRRELPQGLEAGYAVLPQSCHYSIPCCMS